MSRIVIQGAITQQLVTKELSEASWALTRATVVDGQAADPTGAMTLSKFADNATAGVLSHSAINSTLSFTTGDVISFEVMAKAAEYSWIQLVTSNTAFGGVSRRVWFNLSTGVIGVAGNPARMIPCGNGVYRCIVTTTATATGVGNFTVSPSTVDNATAYEGAVGSGIYVGNLLVTSDLVTTWAPNGRAKDSVRVPMNRNTGSIAFTAMMFALPDGTTNAGAIVIDDGTSSNRLYILINSSGNVLVGATVAGVGLAGVSLGAVVPGTLFNIAGGWDTASSTWTLNGAKPVTCARCPPVVNTMRFGTTSSSLSSVLNGEMGPISAVYPYRLSPAQLQIMSAVGPRVVYS